MFEQKLSQEDIQKLFRPRRKILGMSAVYLPFNGGKVDWNGFESHLERTLAAGLVPAVNMDTGWANLIDDATKLEALRRTAALTAGRLFVAGAFVADSPSAGWDLGAYQRQIDPIVARGGTPVIFQSYGLTSGDEAAIPDRYRQLGELSQFIGFELGTMFAPFGRIYSLDTYSKIMEIPQCIGAKHSSLNRELEWRRLMLRDRQRPDFKVFTGNDLAIDMVMYGSDYLLGLSSFAPDKFAFRDRLWEVGDNRFCQLNDLLQYLGCFAFRDPVPAYKHSAAMFLKARGWIASDEPHPRSLRRPETDVPVLAEILRQLEEWQ